MPTRPWDGGRGLVEQPLGDQVAHDVGDGDPGEPAGAGQVGPAGRAVPEEQLEQQRPVVTAGVLGQAAARRAAAAAGPGSRCSSRLLGNLTY